MEVRLPPAAHLSTSGLDVIAKELDELRETQLQAISTLNLRFDELNRRMGAMDSDFANSGGLARQVRTDDLEKRLGCMESTHSKETTALQSELCLLKVRMDRFEDRLHDGQSPACSLSSTRDFDSVHTDGPSISTQTSGRATPNMLLEEAGEEAATNEDTADQLFLSRFMNKAESWNRSVESVDSCTAGRKVACTLPASSRVGGKSAIKATAKSVVGIDIVRMRGRLARHEKNQKVDAAVRIQALFRGVTTRMLNKGRFLERRVAKEKAKQERLAATRKLRCQQEAAVLARIKKEEDAVIRQKLHDFELKWRNAAASRIQARFRGLRVRAAAGKESKSRLEQRAAQQRQQQAKTRSYAKAALLQTGGEDPLQAALEGRLEALEAESRTLRGEFRVLCEGGRLEAFEAESETLREEFRVLCDVVDERITAECDALRVKCERHSETLASWSLGMPSVRKGSDKLAISDDGLQAGCKQTQLDCVKKRRSSKVRRPSTSKDYSAVIATRGQG
jgi:hypothetical protein